MMRSVSALLLSGIPHDVENGAIDIKKRQWEESMTELGTLRHTVPGESTTSKKLWTVDGFVWLLVASSPLIFAILSWNPSQKRDLGQALLLTYSLPITAIEIIVIILALCVGFKPGIVIRRMPAWSRFALMILVAVAVGTIIFVAQNAVPAFIRTYAWAVHLLFGFSVWHLMQTRWAPLRQRIWPSIAVGVGLYLVVLGALLLAIPDERTFDWKALRLGVIHVRQVGFYSVVGAGAALGLAAVERGRIAYWGAVAAASFFLALSFWSGTRGSLLAILAAFMGGLIVLPTMRNWRSIGALAASFLAGGLISLAHLPPHPFYGMLRISRTAAAAGADEMASGRLALWTASARAALDRPLFGYGESQFGIAVPGWAEFNHPHNVFVQVLVQWGIVGFICFFSLAGLLGWHFVTGARRGGPDMVPAFLVAGSLATMSLYEGTLYHPYPVMMLIVALAFVLSTHSREIPGSADSARPA